MDTVETFALSVIHLLIFLQNFAPGPGVPSCLVTGGPLLSFLTPATTITPAEPRQQPPGNTVSGDVKLVTISVFRPAANAMILPAGGISLTSSVQIVARAGLHWAGERAEEEGTVLMCLFVSEEDDLSVGPQCRSCTV